MRKCTHAFKSWEKIYPSRVGVGGQERTYDRMDRTRAIEVTVMFDDTVEHVAYLANRSIRKRSWLTLGIAGVGWLSVAAGIVLAALGITGFGALFIVTGFAGGVYGVVRLKEERRVPQFTVGKADAVDMPLDNSAFTAACFPVVKSDGDRFWLLFTDAMVGDVKVGEKSLTLSELVRSGHAVPASGYTGAYAYEIPDEARITFSVGTHVFFVNSVVAPRPVASPLFSRFDGSVQLSHVMSFGAHALLLFLVFSVPPDAKTLSLDLFDSGADFVRYLVKPEQTKSVQLLPYLNNAKGAQKDVGIEGRRHVGNSGKAGSDLAPKTSKGRYAIKGDDAAADSKLARTFAENAAESMGVLGVLRSRSGGLLASLFGSEKALGENAEDVLGALDGDTIQETYGSYGLDIVGNSRHGGGTGVGTIGLGDRGKIGTIGRGGPKGPGHYGSRAWRPKRQATAPLAGPVPLNPIVKNGALDKAIIRRVIRKHINEIKHCYAKELISDNSLSGRIVMAFTISGSGRVMLSELESSTVDNRNVERCIVKAVRRWAFPKPKGGGIVHVTYPFVFRPAGAAQPHPSR